MNCRKSGTKSKWTTTFTLTPTPEITSSKISSIHTSTGSKMPKTLLKSNKNQPDQHMSCAEVCYQRKIQLKTWGLPYKGIATSQNQFNPPISRITSNLTHVFRQKHLLTSTNLCWDPKATCKKCHPSSKNKPTQWWITWNRAQSLSSPIPCSLLTNSPFCAE